jgi:hypothetical protein
MSTTTTFCKRCLKPYVGKACPRCRPRRRSYFANVPSENPLLAGHWSANVWIRFSVGLLTTFGVLHGLRRLFEAVGCATVGPETALAWSGIPALALWLLIEAVATLCGVIIVSASSSLSWFFGAGIGLCVGFAHVVGYRIGSDLLPEWLYLTIPVFLIGVGVVGSRVGAHLFPPPYQKGPSVAGFGAPAVSPASSWLNLMNLMGMGASLFQAKLNWWRIVVGSAIGILAMFYAGWLFNYTTRVLLLQDLIEQSPNFRASIMTRLIMGVLVFLGAMFAGSSSTNGLAHGIWVALLNCMGYLFAERWNNRPLDLEIMGPMLLIVIAVSLGGAAFGGKILPPVVAGPRAKVRNAEI